jgi:hypothetical protein
MPEDQVQRSILEQHVGTILQIAAVSLLGWSLLTTQSLTKDVEVLKVKIEAMSLTLGQGTNDRYRGADAARDFAAMQNQVDFLAGRLERIESRVGVK